MSLIRAGRIATTATIEEIMKAVRALKESGDVNALKEVYLNPRPAPESTNIARPSTTIAPQTQNLPPEPRELPEAKQEVKHINPTTRRQMLDDELVNSIISSTPGSQLVDIKEASK